MSVAGNKFNTPLSDPVTSQSDLEAINRLGAACRKLKEEIAKWFIGQAFVEDLLTALIARGHCLTNGRRLYRWPYDIACAIGAAFMRIQFTHDLMRSDLTGTEVLKEDRNTGSRAFRFQEGPLFANFILADDFNYAPPQVQAVLLQAMQELRVTVSGRTYDLPQPFFVLAWQNPFKQQGTYPLTEAQRDCFMFEIENPQFVELREDQFLKLYRADNKIDLPKVLTRAEIIQLQQIVSRLQVSDHVAMYALKLTRSSWPDAQSVPGLTKKYVERGAGWRAVEYLVLGAKARAVLVGAPTVTCDHVRAIAPPVLRHRIVLNACGKSDGMTTDQIIHQLLQQVPEPTPRDYN